MELRPLTLQLGARLFESFLAGLQAGLGAGHLILAFGEDRAVYAGEGDAREGVVEALKTVYDPEIPVDIYELGLVYEIDITDTGNMKITMTLTAPGCPVAGILPQQVADAAASVTETGEVEVYLVWDPPWDMEKMSEEARLALDLF